MTSRRRSLRSIFVALVGGLVVLVGAGAATAAAFLLPSAKPEAVPATHTVAGTMQVPTDPSGDGYVCGGMIGPSQALKMFDKHTTEPCEEGPGGGYDDMQDGTQVTVSDSKGQVLAVGHLEGGTYVGAHFAVRWGFKVSGVPDRPLYQIEVGHRGALSYSRADLSKNDWSVALKLG